MSIWAHFTSEIPVLSFRNERDICEVCKPKNRHESPVRLSPTILLPNNRGNVNLFQTKFARLSFPGKSFQWTHSAAAMHYKVRNLKLLHKAKPYHQCQFKHTGLVCHVYSDMGRTTHPPQMRIKDSRNSTGHLHISVGLQGNAELRLNNRMKKRWESMRMERGVKLGFQTSHWGLRRS